MQSSSSDDRLVRAAKDGDAAALDSLLRCHYPRLFAADDATQETLMAIVRGLPKFDGRSTFVTWSHRVATNASLDELRRRERRPRLRPLDDRPERRTGPGPGDAPHVTERLPDDDIEGVADRLDLDQALATLPVDQRVAVVLRDLCALSYDEIASVLDVPPGTVRSRIARGRARMHDHLVGNPTGHDRRPSSQP
ncbi:MAG: RNA polymerase sigma factor [Actinobacteria bacterium]|nr:RNA polymerase sigma factor [Actinomycetota bacterium]